MPMISHDEEDLDDFPVESKDRAAEASVGAYRAESTDQWTARKWDHDKDSTTFWWIHVLGFKHEESIDDWLDLAVLEAEKRGPTLENRLVGDAEMYKGLLDREPLRANDGVKYFRDTLRPPLHQRGSECVLSENFFSSPEQEEETSRWASG